MPVPSFRSLTDRFWGTSEDPQHYAFYKAAADAGVTAAKIIQAGADTTGNVELAYAESSVVQAGIAGALVSLPGIDTGVFTVGARPAYVHLVLPWLFVVGGTAGTLATCIVQIAEFSDAANVSQAGLTLTAAGAGVNGGVASVHVVQRITTPGTYRKVGQVVRFTGTGTPTFTNNLTGGTGAKSKIWVDTK